MTAEPESTNQKKVALPAEEKTPATAEPFDIEGIKKKIPKAFQGYIEPILSWASSVEARLAEIQKEMPAQIQKSMEAAIESQRQKAIAQYQAQPQGPPQQGGFGGLEQMIGPIVQEALKGGGGSYDEEMQSITKEIMRANLERIKQDSSFTEAIKSAIVSKIAGKAAVDIVGNI